MKTKLDKYFRISQRGSTIGTELIGGATTFATMAYILAYMTGAMSAVPGIDLTGVLLCTALITAISCIAMGLVANAPIALAPVLVIPNLVAGMVASGEATYGQAFGTVAISGIVFLLISVLGFGVPFTGSLVLLYVAMLVFAMASGGIGLMVSSLSATQQQAFLGAFTVGVPCILISGAVTPVINMPPFLQYASQLNPMRHFTAIVQGVFLKDITVAAAAVNLGKIACISMVAVGVAVWMFKRKA